MTVVRVRGGHRVVRPHQRNRPLEAHELATMIRRLKRGGDHPALREAVAALERFRNECQGIRS